MSQSADIMRRKPSQSRAAATVDTFFKATAQILESGGAARLTTNHIAERAGFSIGTLYGYFPNKRALLRAMTLREAQRQQTHILQMLDGAGPNISPEDVVRIVIRAVLRPFEGSNRLRIAMMKLMLNDSDVMNAASAAQEQVLIMLLREIGIRSNDGMAEMGVDTAFVLHAAVTGAILAAANERTEHFETQAFEDVIVRLVTSVILRP